MKLRPNIYRWLDRYFLPLERKEIRRTKNIRLIPHERFRKGGKYSYAEWAHVIGIFQTLMFTHLRQKENNRILDVGCGTGLLGIASEPFLGAEGKYVGLDVMREDVEFCRSHYPSTHFEFIHFDLVNPAYAPGQKEAKQPWPIASDSMDMVTALSVWTHLNEADALFYFSEISRVLKPGGKAIVTFFLLDAEYEKSVHLRSRLPGRFHTTSQDDWIFDQSAYGSKDWFHPKQAAIPEQAIGVTPAGLDRLLQRAKLQLIENYRGNWKEVPGVFFQDVLVFAKS